MVRGDRDGATGFELLIDCTGSVVSGKGIVLRSVPGVGPVTPDSWLAQLWLDAPAGTSIGVGSSPVRRVRLGG